MSEKATPTRVTAQILRERRDQLEQAAAELNHRRLNLAGISNPIRRRAEEVAIEVDARDLPEQRRIIADAIDRYNRRASAENRVEQRAG
jgi:hypothetical protein